MKRTIVLAVISVFFISIISCGHLKKPFKNNPGKKKGHNKSELAI